VEGQRGACGRQGVHNVPSARSKAHIRGLCIGAQIAMNKDEELLELQHAGQLINDGAVFGLWIYLYFSSGR